MVASEQLPVSWKELEEAYRTCWQDEWFINDQQREQYREQGLASLKELYHQIHDSRPDPMAVEQAFTMKFGDVVLKGRIDRIDRFEDGIEIIDYKTGSPKTELTKEDKEQLFLYQLAARDILGLVPKKLTYHYLTDNSQVSFWEPMTSYWTFRSRLSPAFRRSVHRSLNRHLAFIVSFVTLPISVNFDNRKFGIMNE